MKHIQVSRPNLLPSNAKKVFSGIIFDVYQWPQKMYDGSMQTWEMLKRPDTAGVIPITSDNKVILQEQQQPGREVYFSLPGGRVEDMDSVSLEAVREFREETGYEPGILKFWKSVREPSHKIDFMAHIFLAQNCKQVADLKTDGGEKIKLKILSLDELLELFVQQRIKFNEIAIEMVRAYYDKEFRKKLEDFFFGDLPELT